MTGSGLRWIVAAVGEFVLQVGVDALRFGELILQDHDPARRVEGVTGIDEFAHMPGDPQLVARVAAVPALGALRSQ